MDLTFAEACILSGLLLASPAAKGISFSRSKILKLDKGSCKIQTPIIKRKHAVIVADTNDSRLGSHFSNTIDIAYDSFIERNYLPEHIHILEGKKKHTVKANIYDCNKKSYLAVMEKLSKDVIQEDLVFLSFLTHGSSRYDLPYLNFGERWIALGKGRENKLFESDLIEANSLLNDSMRVYLFNSCFGGAIAQSIASERAVGISPSGANKPITAEMSYMLEKKYGDQASAFTLGLFLGMRKKLSGLNSSKNLDELFDFAADFEHTHGDRLEVLLQDFAAGRFIDLQNRYGPPKIFEKFCEYADLFLNSPPTIGKANPTLVYDAINPSEIYL